MDSFQNSGQRELRHADAGSYKPTANCRPLQLLDRVLSKLVPQAHVCSSADGPVTLLLVFVHCLNWGIASGTKGCNPSTVTHSQTGQE